MAPHKRLKFDRNTCTRMIVLPKKNVSVKDKTMITLRKYFTLI